jgi:hypothetical protein
MPVVSGPTKTEIDAVRGHPVAFIKNVPAVEATAFAADLLHSRQSHADIGVVSPNTVAGGCQPAPAPERLPRVRAVGEA